MILERDGELAALTRLVDEIGSAGGRVVLVRGEAGIGKSTLIGRFVLDVTETVSTLVGTCDDLLTPQPLGAIWDVARGESSLVQPLSDGDRRAVMEAVLGLMSRTLRPTVLVLEDTQWADEATLDLVKFLGRRIARANGILILTYRDVEVDADHPLRQIVGELPLQNVVRMPLKRLSVGAVTSMIDSTGFDVDAVVALTGGNPLFVTEVLASGTETVPLSVADAVLARASKVSSGARRLLDLVSVAPGEVERALVDEMLPPTEDQLAESFRQGLLRSDDHALSFPHDLQRRAIESRLTPSSRRRLNQLMLDHLGESTDPARLVHHAIQAEDVEAIVRFAPRAARAAMAIESTTEAIAHFRALEPHLERFPPHERAAILADWAQQEFYVGNAESVSLFDRSIALHRSNGDDVALARTLVQASRPNRDHAGPAAALACSTEAVELLEPFGPSSDLASALGHRAFLEFVYEDRDDTVLPLVERTMSVAETVGDDIAMIRALNVKGHLSFSRGDMTGMQYMEECLRRSERIGNHWSEVITLSNMAGMYGDVRDMERAVDFARRAFDTAARYEFRSVEVEARAMIAEFALWMGDWAAAEDAATDSLGSSVHIEVLALRVLGAIQARRGRGEAGAIIARMWSLVLPGEGPTVVDPAAAVLAEYLWLSDNEDPELLTRLDEILALGIDLGNPWPSGALAFWMWKLGRLDSAPAGSADFYSWIIAGDYRRSAAYWHKRQIPYEEGLALMHGDEGEQIHALRIFEDLGATGAADKVRRSLAEAGTKVPRGRSRATRAHSAGLTARQAEVLELLAGNLTNAAIADELFVSRRTVENHVSAVLMKLDVATRDAAVATARAQGILVSEVS